MYIIRVVLVILDYQSAEYMCFLKKKEKRRQYMQLKHLELRNVKTLRDFSRPLPSGLCLIQGKNATGKSSMIESIWASVAGRGFNQPLSNLITKDEDASYITLKFSLGNDEYELTRLFSIKGNNKVALKCNNQEIASTATSLKQILAKLFPSDEVMKLHFIKDVSIKDILNKAVDVDTIIHISKKLHAKVKEELTSLTSESNVLKATEERINHSRKSIIEALDKVTQEITLFNKNADAYRSQIPSGLDLETALWKRDSVAKLQQELMKFEIEHRTNVVQMLDSLKKEVSNSTLKMNQVEQSHQLRLSELYMKLVSALTSALTELNQEVISIQDIASKEKQILLDESKAIADVKRQYSEDIEKCRMDYDASLAELHNTSISLNVTFSNLKERLGLLNTNVANLQTSSKICPTCGQFITDNKALELIEQLKKEMEFVEEKLHSASNEKETVAIQIQQLKDQQKYATQKLENDLADKIAGIQQSTKLLLQQNNEQKIAVSKSHEYAFGKISMIESLLANNNALLKKYVYAMVGGGADSDLVDLEYDDIKDSIKQYANEALKLEHDKMLQVTTLKNHIHGLEQKIAALMAQLEELHIESIKRDKALKMLSLFGLDAQDLNYDWNGAIEILYHLKNIVSSIDTLESQKTLYVTELAKLDVDLSDIKAKLEAIDTKLKDLDVSNIIYSQLVNVRSLKKFVYKSLMKYVNDFFVSTSSLMRIRILFNDAESDDDGGKPIIICTNLNGQEVPVENLSAGESILMRVSMYIGLSRALSALTSNAFKYFFIDEALDVLDSSNVALILEFLKQLTGEPYNYTFYVVSHKQDIHENPSWDHVVDFNLKGGKMT